MDLRSSETWGLPPEYRQILRGFSGTYASWFYHSPSRTLFDAGEGVTPLFGNQIFAIENVVLSHFHLDHTSGLLPLLTARQSMRGPADKPIRVFYPQEDQDGFRRLRTQIDAYLSSEAPVVWVSTEPECRHKIRHWELEAFATRHSVPSLGFRLIENRKKLLIDYVDCTPAQLKTLRKSGIEVQEIFEHPVFAYTGDTGPGLDHELFNNCDLLVHEATFVDPSDRRGSDHATVNDGFDLALRSNSKCLLLHHFSQRYSVTEIFEAVGRCQLQSGYCGQVVIVLGHTEQPQWYRTSTEEGS